MALTLSQAIRDTTDVAAVLQIFEDHVPEDPEIHLNVRALATLARSLETLETRYNNRLHQQLNHDVGILLASLQYTLRRLFDMFGETRSNRDEQRLYLTAWQNMCDDMEESEGGQKLNARLGFYQLFVNEMIDALDGLPPGDMPHHREWIEWLLRHQEQIDEQLNSQALDGAYYRQRRSSYNPYIRPLAVDMPWDGVYNTGAPRPPVPDAPDDFYDTGSPTFSNHTHSTIRTYTTNSSGTAVTGHWAQVLFDHRPPTNEFQTILGTTRCHGRPEHGLVERLRQRSFHEVAKFCFSESELTARFFWRPRDHRSRMLISTIDQLGTQVRFCSSLTELQLVRERNLLHFWRASSTSSISGTQHLRRVLWATFSFRTYEKLILFHCIFTAMKHQDHANGSLRDWPHSLSEQGNEQWEVEIFGGPIEDGGYLHALRLYYDQDSGASRLETRPRRGNFMYCPIWTAFITDHCQLSGWVRQVSSREVQLTTLRLYVFGDGYRPAQGPNGETRLTFRKSSDVELFLSWIEWLRNKRT